GHRDPSAAKRIFAAAPSARVRPRTLPDDERIRAVLATHRFAMRRASASGASERTIRCGQALLNFLRA
ncbi:hypothetical protein, partial [Xanthomonas phaseoli]